MRHLSPMIALFAVFYLASAHAAVPRTVKTKAGAVMVMALAGKLDHPWGMAFLPDGSLLVTERAGRLHMLGTDGKLSGPVSGTPTVYANGQGGLLDVAIDPDFASNQFIYLSFAEPQRNGGAATAVGRGRLENNRIVDFKTLFRQSRAYRDNKHFGGRIVFSGGKLFLTTGERGQFDPAQDLSSHLGKMIRINPDGSIPNDNPFAGQSKAQPEIWSYGHRNIQAAAVRPGTNQLWIVEMGPKGGDELNLVQKGKNYGWPLVSWGTHYTGIDIPGPTTRPEFEDARKHWTPVIAPSGMIFYTGDMFPEWKNSALIGGLMSQGIVRITFDGDQPAKEERIALNARIRDVEQAPDGSIYILTDDDQGQILRLGK